MLALALAGNPVFRIDEIEKDREGPSYTVDTLAELRRGRPGDDFWLLVGGDTVRDLHLWYEPRRILEMAGLLVMARPGIPTPNRDELAARVGLPAGSAPPGNRRGAANRHRQPRPAPPRRRGPQPPLSPAARCRVLCPRPTALPLQYPVSLNTPGSPPPVFYND